MGLFGSTAGAVIGSMIAPGPGLFIGGALGQLVGDGIAGKIEHNKTDEAKYQKFLENNDKIYGRQNDNWLPFFSKNSLMNKITNNSGTQNQNVDSSLANIKELLTKQPKAGLFKSELQEWLGENITTPEVLAKEFMGLAGQIRTNKGLRSSFKANIMEYVGFDKVIYDIQAPFLEMFISSMPESFKSSDAFAKNIESINQDIGRKIQRGQNVDTIEYIPDLAKALNKFNFEQSQEKEEKVKQGLDLQRQTFTEIQRGNDLTENMLKKLESRSFVYKIGASR